MKDKIRMLIEAYRRDIRFRAGLMLYVNLAINCANALFDAVCGYVFRSAWTGTLAFYYIVLSLMRFFILRGHRRADDRSKWKIYRLCGVVLLALTAALVGMHILTMSGDHSITYPWYFIYVVAIYTFYAALFAVRNITIYRKLNDPVISASKAINLAVAAISVYSLQSAMITAFGDGDEAFRTVMGNCVGIGVLIVIVGISTIMLVTAAKALRGI